MSMHVQVLAKRQVAKQYLNVASFLHSIPRSGSGRNKCILSHQLHQLEYHQQLFSFSLQAEKMEISPEAAVERPGIFGNALALVGHN